MVRLSVCSSKSLTPLVVFDERILDRSYYSAQHVLITDSDRLSKILS